MAPVLDKMRDHLIAKNVAAEIAGKLCDSVAAKLQGKVKTSTVINQPLLMIKNSLTQLLFTFV